MYFSLLKALLSPIVKKMLILLTIPQDNIPNPQHVPSKPPVPLLSTTSPFFSEVQLCQPPPFLKLANSYLLFFGPRRSFPSGTHSLPLACSSPSLREPIKQGHMCVLATVIAPVHLHKCWHHCAIPRCLPHRAALPNRTRIQVTDVILSVLAPHLKK